MGDLFFMVKMMVYTLIIVVILQVKVGPTTLEQKLQNLTHHSQLASQIQGVAQGAATFIGIQYNRATGHLNSKYIEKHSSSQRPGERLKVKLKELKESLNKKWDEHEKETSKAPIEEPIETI